MIARKILFCSAVELAVSIIFGGCFGNGYIASSVNTVLGLDVSENPQTQIPHIRFGYVRSGLYYVPTGKTLAQGGQSNSIPGPASETPNVVSEIFVNSKFLSDIVISEKFAIGADAVHSDSANSTFSIPAAQAVASNGTVNAAEVTQARVQAAINRSIRPTEVLLEFNFSVASLPAEYVKIRINALRLFAVLSQLATPHWKSRPIDYAFETGIEYQIGVLLVAEQPGVQPEYRPFWSFEPAEEKKAFEE